MNLHYKTDCWQATDLLVALKRHLWIAPRPASRWLERWPPCHPTPSGQHRVPSIEHRWPLNQDAYQAGGLTTCAKKRLPTDQAEKVANFQLLIAPGSLAPSHVAKYFSFRSVFSEHEYWFESAEASEGTSSYCGIFDQVRVLSLLFHRLLTPQKKSAWPHPSRVIKTNLLLTTMPTIK